MKRVADFYVLLEPRGSFNKAAAVDVRMSKPYIRPSQIAVRVRLTLPENAFTTWVPLVEAEVAPAAVVAPVIEVFENDAPAEIGQAANDAGVPTSRPLVTSRQEQPA